MSSETTENSGVCSVVSHSFFLKWTLKAKQVNCLSLETSNGFVFRSDLYQFKLYKNLRFFLEIHRDRWGTYTILVKGSKNWSFKLAYGFLVCKDRAFELMHSNQLSFLTSFQGCYVKDEKDVAIHCVVNACAPYPAPFAEEDEFSLKEDQTTVDFEGMPNFTLPSDYQNVKVIDFLLKGVIPDWTVDVAVQIIRESEIHKCEVLKILCVEYLMQNITKQNIKQISDAAIDLGLPLLERKCMEKIAYGYFQIK